MQKAYQIMQRNFNNNGSNGSCGNKVFRRHFRANLETNRNFGYVRNLNEIRVVVFWVVTPHGGVVEYRLSNRYANSIFRVKTVSHQTTFFGLKITRCWHFKCTLLSMPRGTIRVK
jgi:hypothetical protein